MSKKQFFIAFMLLAATLSIHLMISADDLTLHIIFRFFYLIPISYVGLKTGKKGGFLVALITSILYSPHFLFGQRSEEFQAGNIVAVVLFYVSGITSGFYRDSSQRVYLAHQSESVGKSPSSSSKKVLFYADDKPLSQFTCEWFVNYFGGGLNIDLTILWISVENVDDILESKAQVNEYINNLENKTKENLFHLTETLLKAGYSPDHIHTKIIKLKDKVRLSSVIQEELFAGGYDFMLIPKYKMSRSQEFLFGDTAIQLIRESGYPVLTVAFDAMG